MNIIIIGQPNSTNSEEILDYQRLINISKLPSVCRVIIISQSPRSELLITKDFSWIRVRKNNNILFSFIRLQSQIIRQLTSVSSCIVFFQGPIRAFPSILFASSSRKKLAVIECHGDILKQSQNYSGSIFKTVYLKIAEYLWIRLALRLCWRIRILSPSNACKNPFDHFPAKLRAYPPYIYVDGIDSLRRSRQKLSDCMRSQTHSNKFIRRIIIAGSLEPVKSFDKIYLYLSNTFRPHDYPLWKEVHIYGDGGLRNLAVDLIDLPYVVWHGHVSQNELFKAMVGAECLFLLSQSEGYPRIVCEALQIGLPVVASDVGHVADIVSGYSYSRVTRRPQSTDDISDIFNLTYNFLYQESDELKFADKLPTDNGSITFLDGISELISEASK